MLLPEFESEPELDVSAPELASIHQHRSVADEAFDVTGVYRESKLQLHWGLGFRV